MNERWDLGSSLVIGFSARFLRFLPFLNVPADGRWTCLSKISDSSHSRTSGSLESISVCECSLKGETPGFILV